jgi:hypothetical protein
MVEQAVKTNDLVIHFYFLELLRVLQAGKR